MATQVQEELMKVQEKFERDIVELHTCVWRQEIDLDDMCSHYSSYAKVPWWYI